MKSIQILQWQSHDKVLGSDACGQCARNRLLSSALLLQVLRHRQYPIMTTAVVPRPIALVSTISKEVEFPAGPLCASV